MDLTPKVKAKKAKINKCVYTKLKDFGTAKETVHKMKRQPTEWEKTFVNLCLIGVAAAAKSLQLCPTLCDPTDGSPPGSAVPGILQARTLEWVAISFALLLSCMSYLYL